ncbi:MAG: hypothetical protein KDB60_07595 [Propionibacteriaceae bacterium]|nr:hypothetical protein [Propionibacteriaceae bacterium]
MPLFPRVKEAPLPEPPVEAPVEPTYLPDPPAPGPAGLRDLTAHRDFLRGHVQALHPFGIGLLDAAGLTLCESIVADLDLPTFTAATTDGWAVRAANLVGATPRMPVVLPVVGEVDVVGHRGAPLPKGTAVRVAAGAPVPEGADTVVPLAEGVAGDDAVRFTAEARFQQNLVRAGSRITDGDLLVPSGTELTPRVLGLIAEVGHDKVLARPRPRVVVLTADTALVEPGLPLTRLSETYDSCTTMLAASVRRDGAQVFTTGIVSAEPKSLGMTLSEQLVRADLVLLVTEVTDDLVAMLAEQGELDVAAVDGLPGRQVFAVVGPERAPVLVLPAGALPAYLAYQLVARTLVRRLAGLDETALAEEVATLTHPLDAEPDRTRLALGHHLQGRVVPVRGDLPGAAELAQANALIVIPPGADPVAAHSDVTCWLLD